MSLFKIIFSRTVLVPVREKYDFKRYMCRVKRNEKEKKATEWIKFEEN